MVLRGVASAARGTFAARADGGRSGHGLRALSRVDLRYAIGSPNGPSILELGGGKHVEGAKQSLAARMAGTNRIEPTGFFGLGQAGVS